MRVRVRARCSPAHEAMKKFRRGSGGGGATRPPRPHWANHQSRSSAGCRRRGRFRCEGRRDARRSHRRPRPPRAGRLAIAVGRRRVGPTRRGWCRRVAEWRACWPAPRSGREFRGSGRLDERPRRIDAGGGEQREVGGRRSAVHQFTGQVDHGAALQLVTPRSDGASVPLDLSVRPWRSRRVRTTTSWPGTRGRCTAGVPAPRTARHHDLHVVEPTRNLRRHGHRGCRR